MCAHKTHTTNACLQIIFRYTLLRVGVDCSFAPPFYVWWQAYVCDHVVNVMSCDFWDGFSVVANEVPPWFSKQERAFFL